MSDFKGFISEISDFAIIYDELHGGKTVEHLLETWLVMWLEIDEQKEGEWT